MKAAVIVFPGSNREQDVARALKKATSHEPAILWHAERDLPNGTDLVVLPGGFSYGDYLRCGAIAARSPILEAVRDHAARGGLTLGICNGFQILCEAGLLPGVLMRNAGMRFICKMQYLRVENAGTRFTRGYAPGQVVKFVIAHGEGNFRAEHETIRAIEDNGQVAFRYCDANGGLDDASNPNGSENGIAGVFNERFNVLGLMPHPENVIDALVSGVDGRPLFEAVAA
jgi:phosphoribosylformylglycinamidine synthase I